MRRYLIGLFLIVLIAMGFSISGNKPALAACPSPLTGKDASGTTQNFGVTVDGSGNCYGNIAIVDGSAAGNKATVTSGNALKVDASATTQPVSQSGSWAFTCSSGCSSSSNQIIAGQPNYPLQVNQVQSLVTTPLGSATLIWDGQHYLSLVPPNGVAAQSQAAVVVRNPDAGNVADAVYPGTGSATENSILKGIYAAATSSLPPGANTIGAVNQSGAWSFTCVLGCIPSNGTVPLLTVQAPTLSPTSLLPSTGLWDGKNYASFAPPNSAPQAWQPALVVTLSPNSPSSGTGANVNVSQFGGTNVVTGTGASGAGIPRFTVSNDSNILATQSGTWTVQQGGAPWSQNLTQVAGNAVSTSASGQLKVGIVGNAGSAMDFSGQAATQPANSLLVGAEFNTTPTTLGSGQASPLQMDSAGNLLVNVKAGGGSGGTSSSFGAAFPSTGTAIGVKNGTNMVNLVADNSGNLDVNCVAGCSSSSFADQSAFTFGTTAINTIGGVYSATPNALASGTAGAALLTQGRILQVNNRDSSGQEVGASLRGQANVPLGVNQVQTALSTPFFPATGLWDGKNYASFAPALGSVIASQPALVTALSPNTPLPAGTNTLGAVTQSGGPWSISGTVTANQGGTWTVQQGGAPWSVSQATAANLNATVVGTGTFAVQAAQSGTWTVQQGGAPWADNVTQFGGTNISTGTGASGAGIPRVTVANDSNILATQSGTWTVQQGTPPWTIQGDSASGASNAGNPVKVGGAFNTTQPTVTNGQTVDAQATARGALIVATGVDTFTVAGSGTFTVAGTVTANQGGAPWSQNVTQFGGVNISTGTGASGTGIPRVTVSNDSNVLVTQSTSPWTIQGDSASGAANAGNPAKVGGVFNTTQPTVTNGQTVDAQATARGALIVATGVDNLTVQQGGAPWSVSQSGTWTVQPGNTANTTPWLTTINQGGNSATVNASGQLTVNCAAGCSSTSFADASAFTFGTTSFSPVGGAYSSAPTPLASGQAGVALLTAGRILQDNPRNSAGQELGANLASYSPPLQVNIASQVTNNTLVKQNDAYGQLRTASMFTDGTQYAALTAPSKPPRQTDSAIVVAQSLVPSIMCPFVQSVSQTASTTTVTNPGGKYLHVCSYKLISASAQNLGLIEGTGTTCTSGTTNLDGQGTSGSLAVAANAGFQTGNGTSQVVIPMQKNGDNLCVVQSAAGNVSGYINYGIFN